MLLRITTAIVPDVVATGVAGNEKLVRSSVNADVNGAGVPVPVRDTAPVPALVVIVAWAVRVPVFAGRNPIEIVQVTPGTRALGQLCVSGNSLGSESVMLMICTEAVPVLLRITTADVADVVPTVVAGNGRLVRSRVKAGADCTCVPVPLRDTTFVPALVLKVAWAVMVPVLECERGRLAQP